MEFLSMVGLLVILTVLFVLIFSLVSDGDLTLLLCERLGVDVSREMGGKVVWVTGASTGIGEALALESARLGARLVISARRETLLEKVKERCVEEGASPDDVLVLPMDVCDFSSHKPNFHKILEKFGRLDVLINNAGRSQRARWEHISPQVDQDLFNLNVFSVVNLTRTVLDHMMANKSGVVSVMSSTAGKVGAPFSGTYTGSKHAIHGYLESLRTEKIGSGVSVCLLCPGPTFSDLLSVAAMEKPGEKFGERMSASDKRMTAERCAQLSMVAIANRLPESWICFRPVLSLMYLYQYCPALTKSAMRLVRPEWLAKVRDSRNAMESDKYK